MAFLPDLLTWSRERGFPFYFSTEATVNLADDPTLLAMMEDVGLQDLTPLMMDRRAVPRGPAPAIRPRVSPRPRWPRSSRRDGPRAPSPSSWPADPLTPSRRGSSR